MTQQASTLKWVLVLLWLGTSIPSVGATELDSWLHAQTAHSTQVMLANIGPSAELPNAARGAVAASPSRNPDYRAIWVRDGALTLDTVVGLYERAQNETEASRYLTLLLDYVDLSRRLQLTANLSGGPDGLGLGEPKFNIDGSAYEVPWGRPQNDGPALRALTLIHFARNLLMDGHGDIVRSKLYAPGLPANTAIKVDLEYVSHHWRDASFDLWEESKGDHFYTRMVQHRALVGGAALADLLGDGTAAAWYRSEARSMEPEIEKHWDAHKGYLTVTLNRVAGADYKSSGLDVAIVLGALHAQPRGENPDSFFTMTDERVLATAAQLAASFQAIYPINSHEMDRDNQKMQPGIGRYPEDRYSGTSTTEQGNAWFLATNAFAEFYFRCAKTWESQGWIRMTSVNAHFFKRLNLSGKVAIRGGERIYSSDPRFRAVIQSLREQGDGYLRRSRYHGDPSGALSEQFNRTSGYMQSAAELTWSHASMLTAAWAREN